jgi:nucleoside-diphosphate-sugar epimerase
MKCSLASPIVLADLQRISARLDIHRALQGKHLLLTGSTGFFGKWLLALIALLNAEGAAIHLSAISRDPDRFVAEYPEYAHATWLSWIRADVRQLQGLTLMRPLDLVLHAATDTLAGADCDRLSIFDTIVTGARQVLDLAVRMGARRVLFTGTGAQYGAIESNHPAPEDLRTACDSALQSSAYAEAKRAQETLASLYAGRHGIEVILTRCFAFAGPGLALDEHFAIGNFVRDALWRDELVLQSSGQAVRSYLHGADLAGWLLTLIIKGQAGEAYNVGSDQGLTIAELAHRVVACIAPGKAVRILGQDSPGAALSYYVPQVEKARELGLDIWTSLDESIKGMASWARG